MKIKKLIKQNILPLVCAMSLLTVPSPVTDAANGVIAFPGAEGAGKYATGGRGGTIYHVTNLNDSGTGSFRDAVSVSNRVVVFDVGGTITLKSDVVVKSNITILGQTAPGGAGITLSGRKLGQGGDNQIIRFISSRPGERGSGEYDAWGGNNGSNSIIDHCSIGWGNDEQWGLYSNNMNQTVQYSIIGPSNCVSTHAKGLHGFGIMFGKGQCSWHHNMIAHNISRNFRGKVEKTNSMDFVNNVLYDWGYQTGYGTLGHMNYVGNYLKAGNSTTSGYHFFAYGSGSNYENFKFYVSGNKITDVNGNDKIAGLESNNWLGVSKFAAADYQSQNSFAVNDVNGNDASVVANAQTADEAFETVLTYAGAGINSDLRPRIDREVMDEARKGKGNLTGACVDTVTDGEQKLAISKYNIKQVNYEDYYPATVQKTITDTDGDGMSDEWEKARNLDPKKDDASGDYLGQGYMNIEYYANDLTIDAFPEGVVEESPTSVDLGPEYKAVKEEIAALSISEDSIKIPSDLALPQTGSKHGLNIIWSSSSSAIKIKNNQINQVNRKTDDQSVTLTANISAGKYTMSKTFSITVVSNASFWKAKDSDNGRKAGTELFDNLTTLFDAEYKAGAANIGGEDFKGTISSGANGKFENGAATGTAFKYEAAENGFLTVYIAILGSAEKPKILYITEEGTKSYKTDSIAQIEGTGGNETLSAKISAGKTYYIYVAGSKGSFAGIEFSQTAKPVWWKATGNVTAGEEMMPGLTASEDLTYNETNKEFDGETFTANAAGSNNPSPNGASGASVRYEASKNGTLTVYCKVGSGKTFKINDSEGTVINEWKNEDEASDFVSLSGEVKAGTTYYAYVAGSKAEFYGVSFLESSEPDNPIIPTDTPSPIPSNTSAPVNTPSPTASDKPAVLPSVDSVVKNGNSITVNVQNGEGMTLDTYIASYSGNKLTGVKKHTGTVSNGKITFDYTVPANAKAFVWDDMKPLYGSCEIQ